MKRREFLKILFSAAGAAVVATQLGGRAAEAAPVSSPAPEPKTPEPAEGAKPTETTAQADERAGDEMSSWHRRWHRPYRRRRRYYYVRPRYFRPRRRFYRRRYW